MTKEERNNAIAYLYSCMGFDEMSNQELMTQLIKYNGEICPNCSMVVCCHDIWQTHEDNEHPDNKTYCTLCDNKSV